MKRIILVIIIFVFKNLFAQGNIIRIPDDYSTIQSGINAATDGDTVLVAPGTYVENINFKGKKIVVASHYCLYHDPEIITLTIIDGSSPSHPDTASVVLFISDEDSTAVLQGFKITGGRGTRWQDKHIGGLYYEGGGILMEGASPIIKNNLIINNQAINNTGVTSAGGGAIRCDDGNPQILNNIIKSNKGLYGAGIVLNYTGAVIKNNIICQNTGGQDYGGSGIWMYKKGPAPKIIENNTIVWNSSTGSGVYGGKGGGILVWSTPVTLRNNIIWANSQSQGGQIAQISGGNAKCTYCNVEGGWSGEGNIDQNPTFVGSNYYLSDQSPCIDTGALDSIYYDPEDPSNPGFAILPSKGSVRNDMGAYGGPGTQFLYKIETAIDEENILPFVTQPYFLGQNYPNPFNSSTKITYSIKKSDFVNLKVYNILGMEIQTLVSEFQKANIYSVTFDASKLSSVIYFYRLKVGSEFLETKKMLLLR